MTLHQNLQTGNRLPAPPHGGSRGPQTGDFEQANEVRSARATLKKKLASGTIELAPLLADPPSWLRTARLRDILLAVPKIGAVKADRLLAHCRIAHSQTLGGLTDRQRGELDQPPPPLTPPEPVVRASATEPAQRPSVVALCRELRQRARTSSSTHQHGGLPPERLSRRPARSASRWLVTFPFARRNTRRSGATSDRRNNPHPYAETRKRP